MKHMEKYVWGTVGYALACIVDLFIAIITK
jgi:hypothetical protein